MRTVSVYLWLCASTLAAFAVVLIGYAVGAFKGITPLAPVGLYLAAWYWNRRANEELSRMRQEVKE